MTSSTGRWFVQLGFRVFHVPGMSRAWQFEFNDGSYVLITDIGGFDLPEPGGPYAVMALSRSDEMLDLQPFLSSARDVFYWFRRMSRLSAARIRERDGSS
jgi:hypothetical protein